MLIKNIKGDKVITDMRMPYRKKKCLAVYRAEDNAYVKVAIFNNDKAAEYFMNYLCDMFNVIEPKE